MFFAASSPPSHAEPLCLLCPHPPPTSQSTCQLAQDQYGNYVIQHVLEHGLPVERMSVINQLAPQIVTMSLHKFASNVVERCLTHCPPAERDVLIRSMLGSHKDMDSLTEEGEDPLQQMMKDQFGNYVVQKVLEVGAAGACGWSHVGVLGAVGWRVAVGCGVGVGWRGLFELCSQG